MYAYACGIFQLWNGPQKKRCIWRNHLANRIQRCLFSARWHFLHQAVFKRDWQLSWTVKFILECEKNEKENITNSWNRITCFCGLHNHKYVYYTAIILDWYTRITDCNSIDNYWWAKK